MVVSVSTSPRQRPVAVGSQGSEDQSDTDNPLTASPPRIRRRRRFLSTQRSSWLAPLTDETGSGSLVLVGLLGLFLVGIVLGCTLPKDMSLPTHWYRVVSSILGYTYFYSWSLSFYPQVITNIANKHTRGLSVDFCLLNVLGFTCYATYTCCLFWNPTIRRLYRERFGPTAEITVQSNDVAFALHAAILSSITLGQIIYFDGIKDTWNNRTSGLVLVFIAGSISCCIIYGILIEGNQNASESQKKGNLNWLDFLYLLSYLKVMITIMKYVPQVILNVRRKSTKGWNIWNVLLDMTGGLLSLVQLIGDCADTSDWSGITGNLAKFFLGLVSILFDAIFMFQHYVLYPETEDTSSLVLDATIPLLSEEDIDYDAL